MVRDEEMNLSGTSLTFLFCQLVTFYEDNITSFFLRSVNKMFFSLIVFGGPEAPFRIYSPLPPLRGQPIVEHYPRWQPIQGLAVHGRLGKLLDSNPDCRFTVWCCYQ
jgi:hypothetical protein